MDIAKKKKKKHFSLLFTQSCCMVLEDLYYSYKDFYHIYLS